MGTGQFVTGVAVTGIILLMILIWWMFHKAKTYSKRKLSDNQKENLELKMLGVIIGVLSLVITAILASYTIGVSTESLATQRELVESQIKFFENTATPNWPTLEASPWNWGKESPLTFSKSDLINDSKHGKRDFYIIMINTGKISSGVLGVESFESTDGEINIYAAEGWKETLEEGVPSQGAKKFKLELRKDGCSFSSREGCDKERISAGMHRFNVVFECEFCKEGFFEMPLEVCVWDQSSNECKQS